MKFKFKGTKQDLLDMGFTANYDNLPYDEYFIPQWEGSNYPTSKEAADLVMIVEKDQTLNFWLSNLNYSTSPDVIDNDEEELYSKEASDELIFWRWFPMDIVCKLFKSGLVELVSDEGAVNEI